MKFISFSQQTIAKHIAHVTPPPVQALLCRPPRGCLDRVSARRPACRYAYIRFPTPQASVKKESTQTLVSFETGVSKIPGLYQTGPKTSTQTLCFCPSPWETSPPAPFPLGKTPPGCPFGTPLQLRNPPKSTQMLVLHAGLVSKITGLYKNPLQKSTQTLYFSKNPLILAPGYERPGASRKSLYSKKELLKCS